MIQRRHSAHTGVGHTIKAINPFRHANRSDMRDYGPISKGPKGTTGKTPSTEFDWDAQLVRHAKTMRDLGYKLSDEQKARIDKGSNDVH